MPALRARARHSSLHHFNINTSLITDISSSLIISFSSFHFDNIIYWLFFIDAARYDAAEMMSLIFFSSPSFFDTIIILIITPLFSYYVFRAFISRHIFIYFHVDVIFAPLIDVYAFVIRPPSYMVTSFRPLHTPLLFIFFADVSFISSTPSYHIGASY